MTLATAILAVIVIIVIVREAVKIIRGLSATLDAAISAAVSTYR